MATGGFEATIKIGERLIAAQLREQQAAEAYRFAPNQFSREIWLLAVYEVGEITAAYMDASMECAGEIGSIAMETEDVPQSA